MHETCRERFSIDLANGDLSPLSAPSLVLNQVLRRQHVRALTCVLDDRSGAIQAVLTDLIVDPDGKTKKARMYVRRGLNRRAVRAASSLGGGRTARQPADDLPSNCCG